MVNKVVVCGDRNWTDSKAIWDRLERLPKTCLIITGGAKGADKIAEQAAIILGNPRHIIMADWNKYGLSAGPIRNRQMLDMKPDLVIAFHSDINNSKGTKDTLNEAKRRGIPTELIE